MENRQINNTEKYMRVMQMFRKMYISTTNVKIKTGGTRKDFFKKKYNM